MLRIYTTPFIKEIYNIIGKYEEYSKWICGECGNKATKISTGWYYPFCDECIKKHNIKKFLNIRDYYKGVSLSE